MSERALPGFAVALLFAVLITFGSFLLFVVQPLVARLALPPLGGAPGVWNSAMMVFQILLLGGYGYAHAIGRLAIQTQALLHIGLLSLSTISLPISLAHIPDAPSGSEALWVPVLFVATIGPVFLLLSAQASLMQRWYAGISGRNPYRLYAASNLGSFAGLVAYPFFVEPRLALGEQSGLWSKGFVLLIVLVGLAALIVRRKAVREAPSETLNTAEETRVSGRTIVLWIALAAVPSGLMLSTTTLLTTDLMAMPLLWVIPLGLYLLSFSVAFSDTGDWARILGTYAPIPLLLVGGLAMISGGQSNPAIALAMVALLFVLAVALHGRLYALRPAPSRLTFFYLVVAAGGALGGTFTALIAPLIFDWVYEHALLLLAAALLLPQRSFLAMAGRCLAGVQASPRFGIALALLALALSIWLHFAVEASAGVQILLAAALLILLGTASVGRARLYVGVLALLMLGMGGYATIETSFAGQRSRSYFGVYSVQKSADGAMLRLNHGTTMHGEQWIAPERRLEPTAYYGLGSGAGLVLAAADRDAKVGIVGLGVGTLACYRKPAQDWTFFEIDPQVLRYSRGGPFTFLSSCAPSAKIVFGDARLQLSQQSGETFDVLAVDAFTSDAIPIHLMTREAFAVYGDVLEDDGVLLVHISNRFVDLAPMVSALGREGGWYGLVRDDLGDLPEGLSQSRWIALGRNRTALRDALGSTGGLWSPLPPPREAAWTDDNASLTSLF
ncbi:hypothetical protein E3U23_05225 [Erythrobacter litoralis]|uniref:fused MFS/spermidine synthase n=1 Tax=Erythrobacter litoralis TaxID=39960 RepID=UPI0024352C0A|nr:fused MFS/spermidine synthase [Erythrobacter litoralis]MDG6078595.1 hypothetical protein [Erythrobacter litoralis]